MLRKKETYTVVTPIPSYIPRQLALDILQSHSEVIALNPLVLSHRPISAPRNAAADEYYSTWYEITQRVQFIPGVGKLGSGQITFNGCFHDMPWGLQTHIYAPMSVDLRNKYRIGGNQPGVEPPEQRELGMEDLGIPSTGLYLRQEAEIKCNIAMMSFVKSELQKACKDMVDRIIKKAELLDSGALQAMFENGKLKTVNPNDRSSLARGSMPLSPVGSFGSPRLGHTSTFYNPNSVSPPPPQSPPLSQQSPQPYVQSYQPRPPEPKERSTVLELPGDYMYMNPGSIPSPQPSPALQQSQRSSMTPSDPRWSQNLQTGGVGHRTSAISTTGSFAAQPPRQSYTAELAAHNETREVHR
ncbi:NACHT and WD40 domain-containing protein [Cordyceps javanica]|uniref:NACHT and WD40 domain-containing protein n=1 Tax=Cordyceps javanica TaxID=43265 RepID=A0A545W6Q2_9HYPO|nr:NACHT and WD40 domain-containing protein [Cordyceps javanica]TQW09632.1 NACHT and WD40 domain protein [Cordyceps javanica]